MTYGERFTTHFKVVGFRHCSIPSDFSGLAQVLNEKDLFSLNSNHRKECVFSVWELVLKNLLPNLGIFGVQPSFKAKESH